MPSSDGKTLVFVRHGATEFNQDGDRFCGSLDPELAADGREQARQAGCRLRAIVPRIDAAWTSPSRRTRETAELLLSGTEWRVVDNLRELSFGKWEGLSKDECRKLMPEAFRAWERDPYHYAPPDGESGLQARARIEDLLSALSKEKAEIILVVSHKTLLRFLVGIAIGVSPVAVRGSLEIHPARLGVLELRGNRGTLKALNL